MTYSELLKIERVLKKRKINCFVDPNRWENKDGYVLYFHKITYAKKTVEIFSKDGIETFDITPNILNAYFKYRLVVKPSKKFDEWIVKEENTKNKNPK